MAPALIPTMKAGSRTWQAQDRWLDDAQDAGTPVLHSSRPLRIAQVAPLFESVPPAGYGGTERVVSYLTEALVEMGHDVTLFASGDSRTRARLVPVVEK